MQVAINTVAKNSRLLLRIPVAPPVVSWLVPDMQVVESTAGGVASVHLTCTSNYPAKIMYAAGSATPPAATLVDTTPPREWAWAGGLGTGAVAGSLGPMPGAAARLDFRAAHGDEGKDLTLCFDCSVYPRLTTRVRDSPPPLSHGPTPPHRQSPASPRFPASALLSHPLLPSMVLVLPVTVASFLGLFLVNPWSFQSRFLGRPGTVKVLLSVPGTIKVPWFLQLRSLGPSETRCPSEEQTERQSHIVWTHCTHDTTHKSPTCSHTRAATLHTLVRCQASRLHTCFLSLSLTHAHSQGTRLFGA